MKAGWGCSSVGRVGCPAWIKHCGQSPVLHTQHGSHTYNFSTRRVEEGGPVARFKASLDYTRPYLNSNNKAQLKTTGLVDTLKDEQSKCAGSFFVILTQLGASWKRTSRGNTPITLICKQVCGASFKIYFQRFICILPAFMYVYRVCASYLGKADEDVRSPGAGVTYGWWSATIWVVGTEWSPLQKQLVCNPLIYLSLFSPEFPRLIMIEIGGLSTLDGSASPGKVVLGGLREQANTQCLWHLIAQVPALTSPQWWTVTEEL